MLSTLETRDGLTSQHPPQHSVHEHRPARRVGLLDRAALRLGLLLVMWGRRSSGLSREQLRSRYEQDEARRAREWLNQRRMFLELTQR